MVIEESRPIARVAGELGINEGTLIALPIATGSALPRRWRASRIAGPLLGMAGFELIAVSVGMVVARASSGGSALMVIVIAGLGVALMLAAALIRVRSVSRAAARDTMVRTGLHVAGPLQA